MFLWPLKRKKSAPTLRKYEKLNKENGITHIILRFSLKFNLFYDDEWCSFIVAVLWNRLACPSGRRSFQNYLTLQIYKLRAFRSTNIDACKMCKFAIESCTFLETNPPDARGLRWVRFQRCTFPWYICAYQKSIFSRGLFSQLII